MEKFGVDVNLTKLLPHKTEQTIKKRISYLYVQKWFPEDEETIRKGILKHGRNPAKIHKALLHRSRSSIIKKVMRVVDQLTKEETPLSQLETQIVEKLKLRQLP